MVVLFESGGGGGALKSLSLLGIGVRKVVFIDSSPSPLWSL